MEEQNIPNALQFSTQHTHTHILNESHNYFALIIYEENNLMKNG